MEREAEPILRFLNLQKDPNFDSHPLASSWIAEFKGMKIALMRPKSDPKFECDSIGAESAAVITYIGIETYQPDLIISCGTAGAFEKLLLNKIRITSINKNTQFIFYGL